MVLHAEKDVSSLPALDGILDGLLHGLIDDIFEGRKSLVDQLLATQQRSKSLKNQESQPLVHALVETQAKKTPDAVAVQFETSTYITYRQLNETANAVARDLVCGRGSIVPIVVSRSPALIIALLAVLKTGAAYVLVSPEAPAERIRFVLEDTHSSFLIVDNNTRGAVPGAHELLIDELVLKASTAPAEKRKNLDVYQAPTDTAYVIYTSGTTGRPKGVVLSHASVEVGLSALPRPGPAERLRQLLCHAPHFSAAQRTILGSLSRGGTLCLASKEAVTVGLLDTLQKMEVSSLEITPSMLKLIDPSTMPTTVKKVVLGGEPVGPAIVEAWAEKVELISAYGLSECTQLNMRHRLLSGQPPNVLGKPSDSTVCYVLAPGSLSPVPAHTPGELCLGGNQLADHYLNLPEKTREVFIPNPFGHGRLYRTGDMVVIRDDGSIELLGRIDQQVKIDGQRVEPSESNAVIQLQPGVKESFVVSATISGRSALAALIVPDYSKDWAALVRDLRRTLKEQIPTYAIPRYWSEVPELPLNASGKVDVVSLVNKVQTMTPTELTPTSGQSNTLDVFEFKVAEAVAGTLSLDVASVDVGLSFQELGGTSLDAIVFASKLRHANIHVSVADILQSSSLREIAARGSNSAVKESKPPKPFSLLPSGPMPKLDGFEDAYPVTPLQEGVLADSILGNANYVYKRVYKLRDVSPTAIRSALQSVINQNAIFRSAFLPWKRGFLQLVRPTLELPWSEISGNDLESALREVEEEELPLVGPLVSATVVGGEYLILQMHHALFDYWSRQFLITDSVSILQGNEPVSRLPFNAYVAYQQEFSRNPETQEFWKKYLNDAPTSVVDLPNLSDPEEDSQSFVLTTKLGDRLAHLSHAASVTVGTAVHAAWALTLAEELASNDVLFITEFSGRDADIDGVLDLGGPTLCTAPMRVSVDGSKTSLEYVKSVQSGLWNLSKYAHTGLRHALSAASVKPTAINTMVNVLVQLGDVAEDSPLVPVITHSNNFTQYINIEVTEDDPTVAKLLVPYSSDLKRASSILDIFKRNVEWLADNLDHPLRDRSRSDSPMQHLLRDESPAPKSATNFGLAHASFEAHAAINPSKTALVTTKGELSYGDLDGKANSFARWLLEQGVQHGEMIPLYMEKSGETLIAILGIMKAGASYTPLDPRNPAERNTFIAKDVGAKRVITDSEHSDECAIFGLPLVVPEEMDLDPAGEPVEVADLTPDSDIYAIYTSGSTGLPKGVLVPHSAVTASTEGMIEATAVTSEWRSLWVLNYVFDASYYDVFTVLSAGATLCIAPQDDVLGDLSGYINKLGVEQVMLTPTITKLIRGGPAEVPRLKVLNVCGEKIDVNILEWAKSVDVYNGYGPTEATILMTVSKVEPDGHLNSIGYPLKHAEAVIVQPENGSLERVADGQVGELCVRGAHLAKGYINRPEQTSAAFVRDIDGEMLYRTGDLASWAEDGSLICLGRRDYQVKLNGFRIELGEIENAILKTGDVDAVVVSVAEVSGKRQLVAFCIFDGDHKPSDNAPMAPETRLGSVLELKQKLTTISHYMMPALFLPFTSFPTLPSGKANRKQLVALVESLDKSIVAQYIPQEESDEEFKPVETEQERIMQEVWSAVLGEPAESIGANSVFFSLGGDSISAINVVAECRRLSYALSVAHVLSNPTLAEQAKHLKKAVEKTKKAKKERKVPDSVLAAIKDAGLDYAKHIEEVLPCGPGQAEFLIQGNTKHQFWNLTACRELPKDFDLEQYKKLTEELTAKNQILRACYHQTDPKDPSSWYQIILRDTTLDWDELTYRSDGEKVRFMEALRDSTFVFGTAHVKYRLLRSLKDGSRTLCIKVNHGSYDGTLLRIFDDQFAAMAAGEKNPKVHSFKEYIDWVSAADHEADLEYWQQALQSYEPAHDLPLQPVTNRLKFATIDAPVDAIAAKFGVTSSTVFLAAYLVTASKITGSQDVLIDNLITGRNADVADPQLLNGTCANFLPLRQQLPGADTPVASFLKDVQSLFWETTEHGTVGLTDIYKRLGRDRASNAAKLLYCFQPFEPAPVGVKPPPRWIVMAQCKVYMEINYALMVEVQKTASGGHRLKLQWDNGAVPEKRVDGEVVGVFEKVFGVMEREGARMGELLA